MPRRNRSRDGGDARPTPSGNGPSTPIGRGRVQPISGSAALKPYRCPGCEGVIPAGMAHVAVWTSADGSDRRHWHTGCWTARERRPPPGRPR